MMHKKDISFGVSLISLTALVLTQTATAAGINSDSLAFFEKPTTFELGQGVIELNTGIELGYRSENNGNAKFDTQTLSSDIAFYTQLDNDWDISLRYLSSYENERSDSYQDILRLGVSDQWGEVQLGEITDIIFERTNRQTTSGLLGANNDAFTLPLDSYGAFYQWSTPATRWMVAVDKDANIEVGTSYYKPIKSVEYVLSARANRIDNDRGDAQGISESDAYAIVAQAQRGRWIVDTQLMKEKLSFLSSNQEVNLNALSAGLHYAANNWQVSLSGVQRENELNDEERTISLGARYDFARGLSINAGTNVVNSELIPEKFRSHAISVNYEF